MKKKNICIVTGTRAEYGLFKPLIKRIYEDSELNLQLVVTGMHLSPEFGFTYKEIESDGWNIDEKVEMLLSSDTKVGISKSIGLGIISFSEVFERIKPDFLVILGDRYEIFAAATAAMISKIPIAHLHGGEITEGAIDEAMRHSISKMSYLHFTSSEAYRKRVIQLGEEPTRVFNVGPIFLDTINELNLMNKEELERSINFKLDREFMLVTFHPVTLESQSSKIQIENLLKALDSFKDIKLIFTKANSDAEGRMINNIIDDYVKKNSDKAVVFDSLGQLRYLSAMKYCSAVVGNSSSGIIEAPILKVPTVNIGDRQKGREQGKTIINCVHYDEKKIEKAIKEALLMKCYLENNNNLNDKSVSENIINTVKRFMNDNKINLKKTFYDLL